MSAGRRHRAGLLVSFLLVPLVAPPGMCAQEAAPPDLEVFVAEGCPRCAEAEAWLEELGRRRPDLRIEVRDVTRDARALGRLRSLADSADLGGVTVPTFHLRQRLVVGFASPETTGRALEAILASAPDTSRVRVPLIGPVRVRDLGLPLFTVVLGLLDGFNPCAMWVLLFVLSLLVNVRSRRRMAAIGGTFVLVSGLVYFAFMAAWLNVYLVFGVSRGIQVALGLAGIGLGALNVKDFFALGRGPSLGIPERAKPGIYARVRSVVTAENLPAALIAVITLGILVNAVELLCTAGLPALYTQILTLRGLPGWQYYGYLGLYGLFYMLDDALVLTVAVVTLSRARLDWGPARWLKLLSGGLMVALGGLLLFRPGWLAA